jgi:hypothetical protein
MILHQKTRYLLSITMATRPPLVRLIPGYLWKRETSIHNGVDVGFTEENSRRQSTRQRCHGDESHGDSLQVSGTITVHCDRVQHIKV